MEGLRSKSYGDGRNQQIQSYYYYGGGEGARGGPTPSSASASSAGSAAVATSMQDLRCYSASYAYASSVYPTTTTTAHTHMPPAAAAAPNNSSDFKFKKGGGSSKSTTNGSAVAAVPSFKSWSFNDPELQRKRRVAGYKVYAVEGKVKGSFKKSFRWLKDRCTRAVYGWW